MLKILSLLLLTSFSLFAHDPLLERSCLADFEKLISKEEIDTKIQETAQILRHDLKITRTEQVVIIGLLTRCLCCGLNWLSHENSY